jgi:sugar lactone lactonase YvrE
MCLSHGQNLFRMLLLILSFAAISGCASSEDGQSYGISGFVQKGPFVQGSKVTIQELDKALVPTGRVYYTQTTDYAGAFTISSKLKNSLVEIITEGYYYNEVTGALSDSPLTLWVYADLKSSPKVNVNILTSLAHDRIKHLMAAGAGFAGAAAQAQSEVLAVFAISNSSLNDFSGMDISADGDSNAVLLACSAILQGSNTVAQLSELLAQLGNDLGLNGSITYAPNTAKLLSNALALHPSIIKANLIARYQSLGVSAKIPSFDKYIVAQQGQPTVSIVAQIESGVNPRGLVIDSHGNLFVGDINNNTVRKYTPSGTGTVFVSSIDAYMLAIDQNDNLYVAPWAGGAIRKISPAGTVTALGTIGSSPTGLTVDPNGNIYYTTETGNVSQNVIMKMAPNGTVTTFAGSGVAGSTNANGTSASFNDPHGLVSDTSGNLFVVDAGGSLIRKITPSGDVSTFSGSGVRGTQNGSSTVASFNFRGAGNQPTGIAISTTNQLFVGQAYGIGLLREVKSDGSVANYCGNGSGDSGAVPGACSQSPLYLAVGITVGPDGCIYYHDGYMSIARICP